MIKYLKFLIQTFGLPWFAFLVLRFFLEILKKKKKSSENDQLTGHFQSFFIYFFSSPNPKSEKNIPVNQLIKKFWPYGHPTRLQ